MTSLLTLLGAVLCSLTVSSDVLPQADFNIHEVAGKWYLIGIASNSHWLVSRRATMKMGTATLKPTAHGDLEISYASLTSDGSCWRKNKLAKKTDVPGKFTYTCERSGALKDMRVVEVRSDQYALVHVSKKEDAETTTVTKLYGRGQELGADVKQKFQQLALQTGTLPENIIFLPKNAECPAA